MDNIFKTKEQKYFEKQVECIKSKVHSYMNSRTNSLKRLKTACAKYQIPYTSRAEQRKLGILVSLRPKIKSLAKHEISVRNSDRFKNTNLRKTVVNFDVRHSEKSPYFESISNSRNSIQKYQVKTNRTYSENDKRPQIKFTPLIAKSEHIKNINLKTKIINNIINTKPVTSFLIRKIQQYDDKTIQDKLQKLKVLHDKYKPQARQKVNRILVFFNMI